MCCVDSCFAGVEYGARNVLADPEIREGIKQFTHWPTIPQVRVGLGGMVGSCTACEAAG